LSTGYPGYDSIIGPENATIGEILKENGYATSWFGKDHNTPAYQYSAAGPFDHDRQRWVSTTSMASWAARPINGSRTCSARIRPDSLSQEFCNCIYELINNVELGDVVHSKAERASYPIFRHNGRFAEMVSAEVAGRFEAPGRSASSQFS
jgi:hypothetical protein